MRIRTILGFSCTNPQIPRNVLRKPRPRVAIFYVFSTLPASGRFASEGSFVSFLVCFRARYYCTLRQLGVSEQGATPSFFTELAYAYLQPGAIRCCLSYGKQCASLRRPNKGVEKLVSMRDYREERSLRTRHGIRGLFAQSYDCLAELGSDVCAKKS